jgi:DNA polymerase-3 subunit delta
VPALSRSDLEKQIAARRLSPLHLFVGEDVRLVEKMIDRVEETVDEADRPFAVERLYATEPGGLPVDIAAAARVFPMLGDRRIVIVLRAERLLKPKRASKSAEAEPAGAAEGDDGEEGAIDFAALEDYVLDPVPSSTLVFVATEIDRGRRFTKRLLEKAHVTEFGGMVADGPPGRAGARPVVPDWIEPEISARGRTIDPVALRMLVDRAGGDVTKLRGDVERLLLYTERQKTITRDDVAEVASVEGVADDWGVVNAIQDGDAGRALREAGARLDRGESVHALVGQLRWWVSSRLAESEPDRVRPAIDALLRTDLALKSSGGDDRVLVERLVVELTGKPVPRRGWR